MLISYALFIFALAFSVVAPPPPPHQQAPSRPEQEWKVLQGNNDPRLINSLWYSVMTLEANDELPSWPKNANLDRVLQFMPVATDAPHANDGVGRVSIYKFHRDLRQNGDHYEFYHPHQTFESFNSETHKRFLHNKKIPGLKGLWAQSMMPKQPKGPAAGPAEAPANRAPVIIVGDVIKIDKLDGLWKFRFIGFNEELDDYTFYPALKSYPLSKKEAISLKLIS
ncbi:hypothetical protein AX14_008135 [Amanita brunnescens Koide BX004]|nr:hypothetical protein AX14_008135 [Amanita brunnescens Koide BX004]